MSNERDLPHAAFDQVAHFLEDRIGFLEMSDLIERCMRQVSFIAHPTLEDYVKTDAETRRLALEGLPVR